MDSDKQSKSIANRSLSKRYHILLSRFFKEARTMIDPRFPGDRLILQPEDFSELIAADDLTGCLYPKLVQPPFDRPDAFKEFIAGLHAIAHPFWIVSAVIVSYKGSDYRIDHPNNRGPCTRTRLDVFFERPGLDGFSNSIRGAGGTAIDERLIRASGSSDSVLADQTPFAMSIDRLIRGTGYVVLNAEAALHKVTLPLNRPALHPKARLNHLNRIEIQQVPTDTIRLYQNGVTQAKINLITADAAIREARDLIMINPVSLYWKQRLEALESYKTPNPRPFLNEENLRNLDISFSRTVKELAAPFDDLFSVYMSAMVNYLNYCRKE